MDKLIDDYRRGYYLTLTPLSHQNDIVMVRSFHLNNELNERYMTDIVIMHKEQLITTNTADSIQFNEELALFDRGDENNKFLKVVQKKGKDGGTIYSLQLSFDDGSAIYIGRSQAKSMVKIWEMSLQRFSFARLVEDVTLIDAEEWNEKLYMQRFISDETYEETKRSFNP